MADFGSMVASAFEGVTPELNGIYSDAIKYSYENWSVLQKSLVTGSGAASSAIPGLHLVGVAADVAFLMNRMAVCSYGIGSIMGHQSGYGNMLEEEDFVIILGRWAGEPGLTNGSISKLAAEAGASMSKKVLGKKLAGMACKNLGILAGKKMGSQMAVKLGGKFGAKLGGKMAAGFIPFFGAAVGAGVNLYFITQIADHATDWYTCKYRLITD